MTSIQKTLIALTCSILIGTSCEKVIDLPLDITEQKKAEIALKEREEIFRHFMQNSPIYVFFKDRDIKTISLSKNYEQMLGLPIEKLIGKSMDEIFKRFKTS